MFLPYGISPQQYNVLRILKGQYPNAISVNCIAERMLDKNSNASRLVDKLNVKGLIIRETCEHDRRQVDIAITDQGLKLLDEMEDMALNMNNSFSKNISESNAKQLNDFLDSIRD